jgi:hypothetical protein
MIHPRESRFAGTLPGSARLQSRRFSERRLLAAACGDPEPLALVLVNVDHLSMQQICRGGGVLGHHPRQFHRLGRQLGQPFRRSGKISGFRLGRVAWRLWRKV